MEDRGRNVFDFFFKFKEYIPMQANEGVSEKDE